MTPSLPLVLAALAVVFSAFVQGSVGFGYALIAAPLLALASDGWVPAPVMLSALVLSAASAWRERASMDRRGVVLALLGRAPGAMVGASALAWLPADSTNVAFGVVVLLAVGMSVSGIRLPLTAPALLGTGFLSGVMGTMTSIGGPPMALVYQHAEGPKLRATLNAYFAAGCAMSLPLLHFAGHFGRAELLKGVSLLPPMALGFWLSSRAHGFLDAGRTRGAVLGVASLSALAVVIKTLWH